MSVIRELVNRISFKINSGDKAKAENAMKGIEAKGAGTIAFFKGLGGAINKTLKLIAGLTIAGTKMFTEFETNQAVSRFFSRTQEEAKQLSDALDKLSGSEIISKREREQAEAALSKLTVPVEDIEKVIPILAEVTVARPDLDFKEVIELTTQFVKTGDIDALEQIGAVGKDTAEAFRLAQLNASTAIKGQRNLFQFLSEGLDRNKEKIKENADLVRDDLGFSFKALAKEASDFTLQFGEETAKPIREIVIVIRDLIKELNESDEFWEGVRSGAEATLEIIKEAIALAKILTVDEDEEKTVTQRQAIEDLNRAEDETIVKNIKKIEKETIDPQSLKASFINIKNIYDKGIVEAFKLESESRSKFEEQQAEKARKGEAPVTALPIIEIIRRALTGTLPGSKGFSEDIKEYEALIEENKKTGPFIIPGSADQPTKTLNESIKETVEIKTLSESIKESTIKETTKEVIKREQTKETETPDVGAKTSFEVSFTPLVIQGENIEGLDLASIQSQLNKAIIGEVRDTFISVAAQSGRLVGVSG